MNSLNITGEDLIKSFEGLSLSVYHDIAGFLTVGYGHKILPSDDLRWGDQISQQQADDFLTKDLDIASSQLVSVLKVELTDNQFSALVSFVYNLGIGRFETSTMLKLLNSNLMDLAAQEFLKWDHSNGIVVQGLLQRRSEERALFLIG